METPAIYPLIILTVGERQKAERVDSYIAGNHKNYSRSKIKALSTDNRLLVNGNPVKVSYQIKPNDVISILTPYSTQGDKLGPQNIPVEVLFEDEHIMVINKKAGIAVHPGLGDYNNTLLNALNYHINIGMDELYHQQIKVVHRLDKSTSGAIVFAKTQLALEQLTEQFTRHTIERTYFAIVCGVPKQTKGTINSFMGRHPLNEKMIMVAPDKSFGKQAITHYEVMEQYGKNASLIKCQLETGRTHQIRIHMQSIGHALINDTRYPDQTSLLTKEITGSCFEILPHQALHAQTVGFEHPVNKQHLHYECPFPDSFLNLIRFLT